MELQDELIKSFTKAINQTGGEQRGEKTVYAEVTGIDNDSDIVFIKMDGSDVETPATSMVKVGIGDRVFATIKSHAVVVTGNISWPALTRVENVYMTMTADGLVIGMLNDENNPVGYRVLISPNNTNPGVYIIDDQNQIVSKFGTTVMLGKPDSYQAELSNGGMRILDPDGNVVAAYGSEVRIGIEGQNSLSIDNNAIIIGKDSASTLRITDSSIRNFSRGVESVFALESVGSGGGLISQIELVADMTGGGGIKRDGVYVISMHGNYVEIGPYGMTDKLKLSIQDGALVGTKKIALVSDYMKLVAHSYTQFDGGQHNRHTITLRPTIPTGYTLLGITQIYVGSNDWVIGSYYIPTGTNDITVRINTVDGENKTDPNSLIVNYIMVRTS